MKVAAVSCCFKSLPETGTKPDYESRDRKGQGDLISGRREAGAEESFRKIEGIEPLDLVGKNAVGDIARIHLGIPGAGAHHHADIVENPGEDFAMAGLAGIFPGLERDEMYGKEQHVVWRRVENPIVGRHFGEDERKKSGTVGRGQSGRKAG